MSFYSADYFNDHISEFRSNEEEMHDQDIINYRDINRIISSPSVKHCFLGRSFDYCPSNKVLKRKPMQLTQLPKNYITEEECVDHLPRAGLINYAKIKKIVQPILFATPFLTSFGLFNTKYLFLGMTTSALTMLPLIVKKISFIAAKKIMDTSESVEHTLNFIEKHCIHSKTVNKIALQDFQHLKYDRILKKYGKSRNGQHELDEELKTEINLFLIKVKEDVNDTAEKFSDEKLKNQIFEIKNRIQINNFIESFEELAKIFHRSQYADTQKLGHFFYEYFDVFDSLGEILRVRITKSAPNTESHHFFIPKAMGSQHNEFIQGIVRSKMKESSSGLIDIKLENTSLKFWKCVSSGRLDESLTGDDLLEIFLEASKYGAHSLLNEFLERLTPLIDSTNVAALKNYGEVYGCAPLTALCHSWMNQNLTSRGAILLVSPQRAEPKILSHPRGATDQPHTFEEVIRIGLFTLLKAAISTQTKTMPPIEPNTLV